MCIVFGSQAWFDKWAFGVRKVVGAELFNESMDYCEWKNGYRRKQLSRFIGRKLITGLYEKTNSIIIKFLFPIVHIYG